MGLPPSRWERVFPIKGEDEVFLAGEFLPVLQTFKVFTTTTHHLAIRPDFRCLASDLQINEFLGFLIFIKDQIYLLNVSPSQLSRLPYPQQSIDEISMSRMSSRSFRSSPDTVF